jgi:hypothetical protein
LDAGDGARLAESLGVRTTHRMYNYAESLHVACQRAPVESPAPEQLLGEPGTQYDVLLWHSAHQDAILSAIRSGYNASQVASTFGLTRAGAKVCPFKLACGV